MAKIVDRPQDGKNEVFAAWHQGGMMGPHWTLWGKGMCVHLYEDESENVLTDKMVLKNASIMEKHSFER